MCERKGVMGDACKFSQSTRYMNLEDEIAPLNIKIYHSQFDYKQSTDVKHMLKYNCIRSCKYAAQNNTLSYVVLIEQIETNSCHYRTNVERVHEFLSLIHI